MTSIGELGTPREPVDLDFTYFGETIRVNPDATDLDVPDMMAKFGHLDEDDPDEDVQAEIMIGMKDMLMAQVHPEDREQFWSLAMANRQFSRDLMTVSKTITAAVAGFPTGQSSDSSTGPPSTVGRSGGAYSNRASRRAARRARKGQGPMIQQDLEPISAETLADALRALDGRPDKQLGLLQLHRIMPAPEEQIAGTG